MSSHRLFDLHARTLAALDEVDGPLPGPPCGFVRAWLDAALPWVPPAHGDALIEHYGRASVEAWVQRFHRSPAPVRALVRQDLRAARTPRLRAALDRLIDGARRAGVPVEGLWGAEDGAALLDRSPRVIDLHASAFFGCCQPMVSLGEVEQDVIVRAVDAGWAVDDLLDARFAGHVVHELAHGPARDWHGGPASWLLHEAAAAVVNLGCQPDHVLAVRPGEPVLGLRQALALGQALVDLLGEHAVWRLALAATGPEAELGPLAAAALTAVDWQRWTRARRDAFLPIHERVLAWAKLADVALSAPGLLPALAALDGVDVVTPERALALPDLLAAAEAVPWERLPAWQGPVTEASLRGIELAVRMVLHHERLQPEVAAVPSDPPRGELVLDVARAALGAHARSDDAHGEPLVARFPPPLCRRLHTRGLRTLVVRGVRWERRREVVQRLTDLCVAVRPLPAVLELDLDARAPHGPPPERVEVRVPPADAQLHHTDGVVTLGSCFATHIGGRLGDALFDVADNPFGILYDPISVGRAARLIASGAPLPDDLLFFAHGRWHSPWHHTDLSDTSREVASAEMGRRLDAARALAGRRATWLLTWGTAWVWEDVATGEVVANCHGLPGERYRSRLLGVDEIVAHTAAALDALPAGVRVVLTVSPIRHLAQGVVGNQRSKATLHLAATALDEVRPELAYFPAYEVVLDELRDHRWYEPDLVHISQQTAGIVYERFLDAHVAPASRAFAREHARLHRGMVAVPRDPLRRRDAAVALLAELDALPRSPALPTPERLRVSLEHTRDAAAALLGDEGTAEVAVVAALAPAPRVERAREVPALAAPAPIAPPEPVGADPDQALARLEAALEPGRYIGWDALAAWGQAVRPAVDEVAATAAGGDAAAWAGLEAVLRKAEELADPIAAVPALAEVLVGAILEGVGGARSRADGTRALAALLVREVPRGHVEARAETLARARPETRRVLAGLVAEAIEARVAEGRRPHPELVGLAARLG